MYRGGTYLSIGDSISWHSLYDRVAPVTLDGNQYNFLTADWIRTNKGNIQFINKGSGGATTKNMMNNSNFWGNIRADLVTICLGMNEASSSSGISTTDYQNNLINIIARLRVMNPSVRIVICTPPPTIQGGYSIAPYATVCVNLATSLNTDASPITVCRFDQAWATTDAGLKSAMPYVNITSISATSTLMTVTAPAHNLVSNTAMTIRGSAQSSYNVTNNLTAPVITVVDANTFTVPGTGFSTAGDSTAGMIGITDLIHPTSTGHVLMANALISVISNDAWYSQLGVIS